MEYRRFGNTIIARIDQGEDVLEKMKRIAMLEDVKLASVSALGTFSSMTVGIYDLEKRQFMGNDFEGMFEIVSFTGTSTRWTESITATSTRRQPTRRAMYTAGI